MMDVAEAIFLGFIIGSLLAGWILLIRSELRKAKAFEKKEQAQTVLYERLIQLLEMEDE